MHRRADLMSRFTELHRCSNSHVHAHDFAFNGNIGVFMGEGELQFRSWNEEASAFDIATAQA